MADFRRDRFAINAQWLMKLRWVAVFGQLTTIVVVAAVLTIPVNLPPLFLALAITTITNGVFTAWLKRREAEGTVVSAHTWHRVFMSLMVLDLFVLSLLLYFTGGHTNPFSLFYFVNLALSGILLPPSRAWLLNTLSIACFAALLYFQRPLPVLQQVDRLSSVASIERLTMAHLGMFVAFAACSSVIIYFVTRLYLELRRGDDARGQANLLQARSDKWEALGTLAAGAAHELATPLTSIAILSKDLERTLADHADGDAIASDIQTIRREVARCRSILDRMSIDAGHATAEPKTTQTAGQLIDAALVEMPDARQRLQVDLDAGTRQLEVDVPVQSVLQALRAVIQNGLDASDEGVVVSVHRDGELLCIEVRDRGTGMAADVLARADEPFFTTKEVGKGMGLGRFLARSVFERLGGTFHTESSVGHGTTVAVRIPLRQSLSLETALVP
ncbi:MAG: ATP-binding protein [Planctomycetota bacterium]